MTEPAKSWWHTAPGILTAVAAIVTAVTGLVVALNQAGFIGASGGARDALVARTANREPVDARSPNVDVTAPETSLDGSREVHFPEGASIRSGDLVYTVLEGWTESYAPGSQLLAVRIRFTNNQAYDANFWDASFRLAVNGLLLAPVGGLNEVVKGNSTSEAVVEFVLRSTVGEAGLQMGAVGENAPALPLLISTGTVP
jgi:hypothetical protein